MAAAQQVHLPLMPKATAVWLVDNTTLTFDQIAHFCGMHPLEVQGIADGEVATSIIGQDPIANGQLAEEELEACLKNAKRMPSLKSTAREHLKQRTKGARYTPVAHRRDKPDGVAWLLKTHPELSEGQIVKLIGTTKNTIQAINSRSHWNSSNIRPRDPVLLGLCSQVALDKAVEKARKLQEKQGKAPAKTTETPDIVAKDSN